MESPLLLDETKKSAEEDDRKDNQSIDWVRKKKSEDRAGKKEEDQRAFELLQEKEEITRFFLGLERVVAEFS